MARGVYDIDFVAFVAHADVLGEDGDAAFALEVVVVEDEFAGLLVVAEELGLMKHTVDEGGLAMVDVGYNSNITNVLHKKMRLFRLAKIRKFPQTAAKKYRKQTYNTDIQRGMAYGFFCPKSRKKAQNCPNTTG